MFLLEWYREFTRIRAEARGLKINLLNEEKEDCKSCETLRQQLEIANYEKEKLLNRLLEKPEPIKEETKPVMVSKPRTVPWAIRRQMLEKEDREAARAMKNAAQSDSVLTNVKLSKEEIIEFEKELDNATETREATSEAVTKEG